MDITNITFHQVIVFFLGFVRIATIIATVPVFGYSSIPMPIKIGLSLFIGWVLFPLIEAGDFLVPMEFLPFFILVMKEVIVGLIIGLAANFLFVGIQMAGELIGVDMGFGIVNIIDPMSGEQVSLIGQYKYILSLLLFLIINGHHFLLNALRGSFQAIPLGTANFRGVITDQIVVLSTEIFKIAIQISGPALASLFLTTFVMGIIARTVPQMNIFIIGFPLKIFVGLFMLAISLPLFVYVFGKLFSRFETSILSIIQVMS
ncbi:MAG: flagellar type III secretion system protein FliR [bacterium]|nr:flagellar type III secretion system protein FliR [bacterium]